MRTFDNALAFSSTMRSAFVLMACAFFAAAIIAQPRVIHVRQGTERRVGVVTITNSCYSATTFTFSGTGLQFVSIVPEQRLFITLQRGQSTTIEVDINARAFVPTGEYAFGFVVSCDTCRYTSCKQDNYSVSGTVRVYDQPQFQVTVLLYSGRPDPTFTTKDPRLGDAVHKALAASPASIIPAGQTIRPRTLGYNGIVISAVEDDVPLPLPLVIYNEQIEVFANILKRRPFPLYRDPSRQLENMVLDLGVALKALTLSEVQEIRAFANRQP